MLLGLTSTFQPLWLGWPYQEHEAPASTAFQVTEVLNTPTTERCSELGARPLAEFLLTILLIFSLPDITFCW